MKRQDVDTFLDENAIRTVIVAGTDPMACCAASVDRSLLQERHRLGLTFAWFIMRTTTVDDVLPDMLGTGVPDVKGVPEPLDTSAGAVGTRHRHRVNRLGLARRQPLPLLPAQRAQTPGRAMRNQNVVETRALEFEFYLMPKPVADIRRGDFSGLGPASQDIHLLFDL